MAFVNKKIATKFNNLQEMHEFYQQEATHPTVKNKKRKITINDSDDSESNEPATTSTSESSSSNKNKSKNNKCSMYPISNRNSGVSCNMTR